VRILNKIKSVGLIKLVEILVFRVARFFVDINERIYLRLFYKRPKQTLLKQVLPEEIQKQFASYYRLCVFPIESIKSKSLFETNISLFGKIFNFNDSDWLRDPVSYREWPSTYFVKAKVEATGMGDVKYVMEVNKLYHIVNYAQLYYSSGKEEYIHKIGQSLEGQRRSVKYERSVVNKSMLDLVYRCYNLVHIILLCYKNEMFRIDVLPEILTDLRLLERQIRKFSTPRWCKYSTGANHSIGEMAGLIAVQQVIQYLTCQSYDKYLKTEYRHLYKSLDNIITEEGVYLEQSANYSKLVTEFLIILDIFSNSIGSDKCKELYRDVYLKKLLVYINTLSYHDILPDFGDNDGAKALTPFYDSRRSIAHINKYFIERFPKEVSKFSMSDKTSGQFIWKSRENNGLWFFTRVGRHSFLPLGSGSHAHNDQLAIWMGYKGYPIFIDYGTFFYNSGIDIINKDRSTKMHNTLSVDNIEQAKFAGKWLYGSYPDGKITKTLVADDGFEFCGQCKYSQINHLRNVKYRNHEMAISDKVDCPNDSEVSLSFVLAPEIEPVLMKNNVDFFIKGQLLLSMMCQDGCIVERQTIEYHPSYGESAPTVLLSITSQKKGSQQIETIINFQE
jgi:hypothetical protein